MKLGGGLRKRKRFTGAVASRATSRISHSPAAVKLEAEAGRTSRAVELLEQALEIQGCLHNPGEAKSRLLLCRISGSATTSGLERHRERIILLAAERPGLARCPVLDTILETGRIGSAVIPLPQDPKKPGVTGFGEFEGERSTGHGSSVACAVSASLSERSSTGSGPSEIR